MNFYYVITAKSNYGYIISPYRISTHYHYIVRQVTRINKLYPDVALHSQK